MCLDRTSEATFCRCHAVVVGKLASTEVQGVGEGALFCQRQEGVSNKSWGFTCVLGD